MILFFDTETTGLPNYRMPCGHELQPHLVQIAAILTDDDGSERASINLIVNPKVPIPAQASLVHGITDELVDRAGVFTNTAVAMWDRLAERADTIVAHNIAFDLFLMQVAWERAASAVSRTFDAAHGTRARFCTMNAASHIMNLPPTERMVAAGFTKPKPPKLEECVSHFFGETLDGAHDALVDVRACARVYFHLRRLAAQPAQEAAE